MRILEIGGEMFTDRATGANNPIRHIWTEAKDTFSQGPDRRLTDHFQCLVSIGTGKQNLTAFNMDVRKFFIDSLVSITTNSNQTADEFQKLNSELFKQRVAFRYNVDRGLEAIGLEEADMVNEIRAASRRYIQTEDVFNSITDCTEQLKAKYCMYNEFC